MLVVSLHVLLKVRVTVLEASLSRMEEKTDWGGLIPGGKEKEELTSK